MHPSIRPLLIIALSLAVACTPTPTRVTPAPRATATPAGSAAPVSLDHLVEGADVQGFRSTAVYLDDDDRARGARFIHARTGLVFDYLQIESAPQAFVAVSTYPTSDKGEPHTQEHLLLGKGNKGHYLGAVEHALLGDETAFTAQHWTAYHFGTQASPETFWPLLRTELDTILHPDYTEEEVRREVRNFGVAKAADGTLALDEKGTVYNEMSRVYEHPGSLTWRTLGRMIHGEEHPLSWDSGGSPEGIRSLTPADIRTFHAAHYQLGNMGIIGAFPSAEPLQNVLARVGETLDALAPPNAPPRAFFGESSLPPARGAKAGTLAVTEYPYASGDHPGPAELGWPAARKLTVSDRLLLEVFVAAFSDGEGSNLYKALVDRKTRALDYGATSVWSYVETDPGQPVRIGIENVSSAHADEASLRAMRGLVLAQLRAVAAFPDGSKELAEFNTRVKARIVERRRWLDKMLDTPPQFGTRGTDDGWYRHLEDENRTAGFRKSLTNRDAFARALALTDARENAWRERIPGWGLLDEPYGVVARPNPALRRRLDAEREARIHEELTRLEASYNTSDPQDALRRRAAEIAQANEVIARAEASVPTPPMLEHPPMTLDESLAWRKETIRGVPVVASTFETMKSASVGLALRLDGVPEDLLPYVALLPSLVRSAGVVRDGVAIPYDEMNDRLRREVLTVSTFFDVEFAKDRAELVFHASGDNAEETRRALGWLHDMLTSPDWRPENLPRVRDVVAEQAANLHDVMAGSEEAWVEDAADAYWRQDRSVLLHTGSFLTRAHDAYTLSWKLAGAEGAKEVGAFLGTLAGAGSKMNRASLDALTQALAAEEPRKSSPTIAPYVAAARALPAGAVPLARKAGRDLGQLLGDLPDGTLAKDWAALCEGMKHNVARPPSEALDALTRVLRSIRHTDGARVWMVGSARHQAAIRDDLDHLLGALDPRPSARPARSSTKRTVERARARGESGTDPTLVAIVNSSTASASIVTSAPVASYGESGDATLVDFLSASVFRGAGPHTFALRIWGAGLAYTGVARVRARRGRMALYADRSADLPQLLRFANEEVRRAPADPKFVDYTVVGAFDTRARDTYESRAANMAADLADGVTPEKVRDFHARLLALRTRPGIAQAIHDRLVPVYSSILPTLDPKAPLPAGGVYVVFGPEAQIAAYERELRDTRGPATRVIRLYPRDFWDE